MFGKSSKNPPPPYDQTSFQINYQHGITQLQQIRINYKWVNTNWKHRHPRLNVQWFNKTESAMELISEVDGQTYQPSVMDVGTTIYLQMTPESKQMEYVGMPIVKFIGPLALNQETEEQVSQLMEVGKSTYFVQVTELKLKGLPKMESNIGAPPLKQCLLKVMKGGLVLMGKWSTSDKAETIMDIKITKKYPKLVINRKKCKQMTIWFNSQQYANVVLQNHKVRDVLYLVVERIRQGCTEEQIEESQAVKSAESLGSEVVKSDESFKKSEETLPQSPQTKVVDKTQKQLDLKVQAVQQAKEKESQSFRAERQELEAELQILRQVLNTSDQKYVQLQRQVESSKQEACYHKNENRLLNEKLKEQLTLNEQYKQKVDLLSTKALLSIEPEAAFKAYGQYVDFTFEQLLQQLVKREEQIKQINSKYKYQLEHREQYEFEIRQLTERIQNNEGVIKHLEKKVESLTKDKYLLTEQVSTQYTYSSQLGSYEFEIGKLKEEIKISQQDKSHETESLSKQISSLKIQVKELIQENIYLRSKEKSSKSELKNQMVELKKLVNRFGESMAEKDIQLDNLRLANKELNKELNLLRQKTK